MSGTTDGYLTFAGSTADAQRILSDYQRLAGQKFAEGLQGFQSAANEKGLLYRQQPYNPPMDIIGASKYVDIPEDEQHDEFALRTASSGAHLYGRELATAEQFTLGLTPLQNSLETLKVGVDLMATAGINNFFYHGFNYDYGVGSERYGENGWAAFPTIGVHMGEENTLSRFFPDLNAYASRLNFVTQQGVPSSDVAVYAPFNSRAVASGATPTLNANGYTWDVINDDSITNLETVWDDGSLSVNGGNVEYDALVVHTSTVPVATMERLLDLAEDGAPIVFFGALPAAQAGYADGAYAVEDAKVADLAARIVATDAGEHPADAAGLASVLADVVDPEVSYEYNEDVRLIRRTLDNGAELTYIRNIATTPNTITVHADEKFENFHWLDQEDGGIYPAEVVDGQVTFTLDAGKDALGRGATQARPSKGIVLLAEPAGSVIPADALREGLPGAVDRVAPSVVFPVEAVSLTVSDDALDGVRGGEVLTRTFTENVLGNWKDATYQDGTLRSVVSDGIYTATVMVDELSAERYVLDLGEVFSAATVKVNGADAGRVTWAPFEVDITDQLVEGVNEIEIAVTPRKKNRYFPAAVNASGQYSMANPQDAGLVGPLTLNAFVAPLAAEVSPRTLAGKVYLSVSATNNTTVPVDVVIATEYGGKTFTDVAPGKTVSVSVNTRLATVPAGEATVTATGDGVSETKTAPFGAYPTGG